MTLKVIVSIYMHKHGEVISNIVLCNTKVVNFKVQAMDWCCIHYYIAHDNCLIWCLAHVQAWWGSNNIFYLYIYVLGSSLKRRGLTMCSTEKALVISVWGNGHKLVASRKQTFWYHAQTWWDN